MEQTGLLISSVYYKVLRQYLHYYGIYLNNLYYTADIQSAQKVNLHINLTHI